MLAPLLLVCPKYSIQKKQKHIEYVQTMNNFNELLYRYNLSWSYVDPFQCIQVNSNKMRDKYCQ
jgi:hypothetical protein